jgi:hypothetical protein
VLSTLLGLPLPGDLAVTGSVSLDDRLRIDDVGGLEEKLAAAHAAGLRALVPGDEASTDDVLQVRSLPAAVNLVFGQEAVEKGLRRLHEIRLPISARERRFKTWDDEIPRGGLLISAIGRTDPRPTPWEDGNVLAIASRYAPSRALLLHTAEPEFRTHAADTEAELLRMGVSADRHEIDVADPTDYGQLFRAIREAVLSWLPERGEAPEVPVLTNISSGTPQMTLTLHLLIERGVLADLAIQVREAAAVPRGEHRVRRIRLPLL